MPHGLSGMFKSWHQDPRAVRQTKDPNKSSDGDTETGMITSDRDAAVVWRDRVFYRYRKQRGVNLGSWFVLERWITDAPFRHAIAPAQSDYDVARGEKARETLENHWDTWVQDDDWRWIAERGLNAVRIPIGYYHLCALDPSILSGTDFEGLGAVFEGAWNRIHKACNTARAFGLGVFLDLHAAPGKQNADAHSGKSGSEVQFYKSANLRRTVHVLRSLLNAVHDMPNLVGIQLINEPQNSNKLQGWYDSAVASLRELSTDVPLYLHDAWDTNHYVSYVGNQPTFVVLDHHLYRCFTPDDHHLTGDQHADVLRTSTSKTFEWHSRSSRGNLIVGEFSAALNPASIPPGSDAGEQDRQRRVFARAQLEMYEQHCGGWFFWTYKKGSGWDAGWSLRDATTAEIMPSYYGTKRSEGTAPILDSIKRDEMGKTALHHHSTHWGQYPSHYEHWRFEDGFAQGWNDTYAFAAFQPSGSHSLSEIGFIGELTKLRLNEHIQEKGRAEGKNLWEFEHGFLQGSGAAWRDIAQS